MLRSRRVFESRLVQPNLRLYCNILFSHSRYFSFHGDFTEVFMVVGEPWVPKIQYTLSP